MPLAKDESFKIVLVFPDSLQAKSLNLFKPAALLSKYQVRSPPAVTWAGVLGAAVSVGRTVDLTPSPPLLALSPPLLGAGRVSYSVLLGCCGSHPSTELLGGLCGTVLVFSSLIAS